MKAKITLFFTLPTVIILNSCGSNPETSGNDGGKSISLTDSLEKTNKSGQGVIGLPTCESFNFEDGIDLVDYFKTFTEARTQKTNFSSNFRYSAEPDQAALSALDPSPVKLNMTEIVWLHNQIKSEVANIRALEIHLGLSGNKIIYLLRNIILNCSQSEDDDGGRYKYSRTEKGVPYICNGDGTIDTVSVAVFNALCENYAYRIRIKHKSAEEFTYRTYNDPAGWKNDTKSIIFSYQELFTYYYEKDKCVGGVNDHELPLWIHNGSAPKGQNDQKKDTKEEDKVNKHTLFFAMVNPLPAGDGDKDVLVPDIANLAHLCPPSCFPVFKIKPGAKHDCVNP